MSIGGCLYVIFEDLGNRKSVHISDYMLIMKLLIIVGF
jgi:hypothetical protein